MVAQLSLQYLLARPTKVASRMISYALFEGRPLTTRGQWINPLLFAHFALEKRLPQLKRVEKPLFVLGTGRSGTTVLGVTLSMHHDVGFLNEPKALWHAIFPDEDVVGNYTRGPAYYRLYASDVQPWVKRNAHKLFGAYLASVFSSQLVDKYPELVFRVPFVRQIFPDAKFIFMVRNGWDTCASIDKWSKTHGNNRQGEVHDWWGVDQRKWRLMNEELIAADPYFDDIKSIVPDLMRHTDMAVVEWMVTMREGMRCKHEFGDCIHRVRYEELVAAPRKVLSEIAAFAGLSDDETYLAYGESVLTPMPRHAEFDMHPALRPLFDETMRELGY